MKIVFTPEELAEAVMLLRQVYGTDDKAEEENRFTEAVDKAICEKLMVKGAEPPKPKAVEPKAKPKTEPKKPGPKPRVDRGKVMALFDAEWSVAKIADEMQCSTTTVKKIIEEEEDKRYGQKA